MTDADRTSRLRRLDRAHLWHPFTQMADWVESDPIVIAAGEGAYLEGTDGRRYLDGVSSLWCNLHGHRRPEIDEAVRRQLDRIAHSTLLGLASPPSIELAARLAERSPGDLARVFYSDAGATAVEIALKMAFQYWQQCDPPQPQRTRFVHLDEAYHGDTLGAVSVGGIDLFHTTYRPLLFETLSAPAPYCYRCPLDRERQTCGLACAAAMENLLEDEGDHVAAVILEPLVQGAAGMITHPEGYLQRVAEACRRHGALLIADEVATGFGRTGRFLACEHEDVAPDLLCLGKGISGGYLPLAATLASERIYNAFLGDYTDYRTFFHGHTYTGNALACAAGVASLGIFETDGTLERVAAVAGRLAEGLAPIADMPHVGEVRQRGVMVGIELVADRATREPYPPGERRAARACEAAIRRGVWIRPLGDVVILMPPYCVTDDDVDRLTAAVAEGIAEATERLRRLPPRRTRTTNGNGHGEVSRLGPQGPRSE
jgi:adenosylmethionine-8-amino-7-oxononanoate aminotransferase